MADYEKDLIKKIKDNFYVEHPNEFFNANTEENRRKIYDLLPPNFQEIWDEMLMPVDTNIDFDKVILSDTNREKYATFISEQDKKALLFQYDFAPMNRLLLYGASGTGKTYSLKALANKLGFLMLYVDIAEALTKGNVSENIHKIFDLSHILGECIVFFDECDSIAWNRDSSSGEGGVARRATNSIFQCLDQMDKRCIFVSATNMLNRLDLAFERRFDMKLQFETPRLDIVDSIKVFNKGRFEIVNNVDESQAQIIQRRMEQSPKASYYGIQIAVEGAMKESLLQGRGPVLYTKDVYDRIALALDIKFKRRNIYND